MPQKSTADAIEALVARLKTASWKERDAIKAELRRVAGQDRDRSGVRDVLAAAAHDISDLEIRWEIEEVMEALEPPKKPKKEEEPPREDANRALTAADLTLVYDDPRGLMIHKSKTGNRWFATQRDPRTGAPQTFELHQSEVEQLKHQLSASPYWVLGSGVASP
jgi:hypothetical protein